MKRCQDLPSIARGQKQSSSSEAHTAAETAMVHAWLSMHSLCLLNRIHPKRTSYKPELCCPELDSSWSVRLPADAVPYKTQRKASHHSSHGHSTSLEALVDYFSNKKSMTFACNDTFTCGPEAVWQLQVFLHNSDIGKTSSGQSGPLQ